jgi:hypothetical protein
MPVSTDLVVDVVDMPASTVGPIGATATGSTFTVPATGGSLGGGAIGAAALAEASVARVDTTVSTAAVPSQSVSAPTATVTVGSTATGPSFNVTGSQAVVAPTVSTTVTNNGTTTQTIACKCCGAASDPCCGPFDRTGPYFNRWFKGTEWSSGIVGRGKTTAPAKFLLSIIFGNSGTWSSPGDGNTDLQQSFDLEFEYYDPGEAVILPYPFRRYEVARWTNTGPVKCRLLSDTTWEDGSATDGASAYRGKAGNLWLSFESEYIYLLTGYRNTNQFTSTYQTDDMVNSFVLLSSLENLDTDTFSYVQSGEAAKPSSYKVFFQRWNPKTASVYGYRYHMKTAQCRQAILGPTIDQLTWVPSIHGCGLQIQTQGNRSTATGGGNAIVFSVESCTVGSNVFGPLLGNCNSFGANLTLRRDQSCQCPNGYAQQLFGPNGLCPNLDFGFKRIELQAELTAYTHVSPYNSSNTSTPQTPFSLGYFGIGFGNPCLDFYGNNSLWFVNARDDTNYPVYYVYSGFSFELQSSGDPIIAKPVINGIGNLVGWDGVLGTWSELTAWKKTYSSSVALRGPVPASGPAPLQLQYVSHSCSPFSMTFSGSLWMKYENFGPAFDKHIANIEITFFLPQNGLVSMAGPPAQTINPTVAQALIQQSKTRLALPCIHRGEPLEASASCGCGGAVLTECAVYGQCRPYGTATDAQVCTRCPDYAAP